MTDRYHPLGKGSIVTSPFGQRPGEFHTGVDFGFPAGSSNRSVYAIQSGTVQFAGAAQGYGGPDPAGWLVIDSDDAEGGGCIEYGHIVRRCNKGDHVKAGQLIAIINPDKRTNAGVDPHLHVSYMPREYNPATKQDVMPLLKGALDPITSTKPDRNPVVLPPIRQEGSPVPQLADPFTGAVWSPSHSKRNLGTPRWIAIHTQEGGRTARGLADFLANPANQVSYHAVNDDHEILKVVGEDQRPWAAMNANDYAFHICGAGTYAGWSRGKWLETDASDGKNEDLELTNTAKVVAWWCRKYNIPPVYIGGRGIPWGRDGICGHMDFGDWGGGHHDPGTNYPFDELIRRVVGLLDGTTVAPLPAPTPIPLPGTNPDKYAGVLLYRGRPDNDPALVTALQQRLKRAYSKLVVDGVYGEHTELCVRDYQHLHPPLVADGIVGPMTAAALKAW